MKYAIIFSDGCNGWRFGGIATKEEVKKRYPKASSRNRDGLLELDEGGETLAVPCEGKECTFEDVDGEEDQG